MFIPHAVKSIQPFTCTFNGLAATADATLGSAVILANSIIIPNGYRVVGSASGFFTPFAYAYSQMQSTTVVRATCNGNAPNGSTYKGLVLEFYGGFIRYQKQNTISIANTATTGTDACTITNTNKTLIVPTGANFSSSLIFSGALGDNVDDDVGFDIVITSTILITASWTWDINNTRPTGRVVGYNLLEFR